MPATTPYVHLPSEPARQSRRGIGPAIVVAGVLVAMLIVVGSWFAGTYNSLVTLDQAVQAQWAQVENVYQRRADLVPNLVATVKGAAGFEQQTLVAVTEARAQLQSAGGAAPTTPEDFERSQRQQDQLGGALARLMVVVEAYPQLGATMAFRDLQSQLEGTENRITVERMRFNEAAQRFNARRDTFPTSVVAGYFGTRFAPKLYFKAQGGAEQAPKVRF